jgi:hypothetical protein
MLHGQQNVKELLIFVHLTVTSADVEMLRLVFDRSFSRYAVCFNYGIGMHIINVRKT